MNQKLSWLYFVVIFFSVIVTMFFHEFGHYIVGVISGNHVQVSLTNVKILGESNSAISKNIGTLGGPLFTLLQTIVVALILLNRKELFLYPLLIAGPIVRLIPNINVLINYNKIIGEDEAILSRAIGLPNVVIPILIISILIGIVIYINYKLKISYKNLLITVGGVIISFMILFNISRLISSMP